MLTEDRGSSVRIEALLQGLEDHTPLILDSWSPHPCQSDRQFVGPETAIFHVCERVDDLSTVAVGEVVCAMLCYAMLCYEGQQQTSSQGSAIKFHCPTPRWHSSIMAWQVELKSRGPVRIAHRLTPKTTSRVSRVCSRFQLLEISSNLFTGLNRWSSKHYYFIHNYIQALGSVHA